MSCAFFFGLIQLSKHGGKLVGNIGLSYDLQVMRAAQGTY